MKCPICGYQKFYVKDPEDEYEVFPFEVKGGKIHFDSEVHESEAPQINENTETYCDQCAWHGPLQEMKK